jgi:hypothetical protein
MIFLDRFGQRLLMCHGSCGGRKAIYRWIGVTGKNEKRVTVLKSMSLVYVLVQSFWCCHDLIVDSLLTYIGGGGSPITTHASLGRSQALVPVTYSKLPTFKSSRPLDPKFHFIAFIHENVGWKNHHKTPSWNGQFILCGRHFESIRCPNSRVDVARSVAEEEEE